MFTKEERLFIWKEAYREIEELRTGEYICVALKHAVLKFFVTPKNSGTFYGMPLYELVRTYFPELEKKKSMATEPKGKWGMYGWFGCISPETREVRLNIVKDIIKELE